ncbi:MAG: hypothetical protein JST81_02455 [Bacteroidetes bacterium]|nr:hypothetical protein [Bacteroidota bacterium]
MRTIIKIILLLVISFSVNSKDVCTTVCEVKNLEAILKAPKHPDTMVDENDWILNTRFRY